MLQFSKLSSKLALYFLTHCNNRAATYNYLRESMEEKHQRFGFVASSDVVELNPVGSDILVLPERRI